MGRVQLLGPLTFRSRANHSSNIMHTDSESVAGSHHQDERSPPEQSTPELMQICNKKVAWRQGAVLIVVIVVIVVVLVFSQTFCLKFSKNLL